MYVKICKEKELPLKFAAFSFTIKSMLRLQVKTNTSKLSEKADTIRSSAAHGGIWKDRSLSASQPFPIPCQFFGNCFL